MLGSVRFGFGGVAGWNLAQSCEDSAGMWGFLWRRDNAFCATRYRQGGSEQTAPFIGRGECVMASLLEMIDNWMFLIVSGHDSHCGLGQGV